ncbi:TnpV protein (plasmid) [Enterococcus sp. 22-H-5-01]|uniref:TnpV protein n=1 Tax=Enterococcus sp. 22-H-5-01 TaxID=3418555 RepID=UPI003D01A297
MNEQDKLMAYQEEMNNQNQQNNRRKEPIIQPTYQATENGTQEPLFMEMTDNHPLSHNEQAILRFLQESKPNLYHELYLTGELMTYLKQQETRMEQRKNQLYQELLQKQESQLPTDFMKRTQALNQIKWTVQEMIQAEFLMN